jgi:DNA-binding NarL/FixJ family response regulator
VAARIATLTEREHEITSLLAEGLSNKQIADHLTISETTVSHHLTSIFHKLDIATRLELVVFAYRHGLAQPQP